MISETAYTIEILLEPRRGARAGVYNVITIDRNRQRLFEGGVADLGLIGRAVALPSGRPLLAEEFLGRYRRGAPASEEHGIAFGRMLLGFLLGDPRLLRAWNEMQSARMSSGLPMRLLLRLPRAGSARLAWRAPENTDEPRAQVAVDIEIIPFELLADEHGFLFKDRGHTVVRLIDRADFATAVERVEGPAVTRRAGAAAPDAVARARPKPPPEIGAQGSHAGELSWVTVVVQPALPPPLPALEDTVRTWTLGRSGAIGALTDELPPAPVMDPSPLFRGRSALVQQVVSMLAGERLISVVGMPGIGKTDVVAAAAQRALFDDGFNLENALWLSLDGLKDVDALRARIALALGLDPTACKSDEQLAGGVGEGPTLLVLDKVDALLGDALTRTRLEWLLNTLLTERRELRILLATQRRVGEASAKDAIVRLDALGAPADRDLFLAAAGARVEPGEHRSADLAELLKDLRGHSRSLLLAASLVGSGASLGALRARIAEDEPRVDPRIARALLKEREGAPASEDLHRASRYVRCLNLAVDAIREAEPRALEVFVWLGQLPAGLPEVLFPHVFGSGAERIGALLLREGLVDRRDLDRVIRVAAPIGCFAITPEEVIPERRRVELLIATLPALGAWISITGGQAGISGAGVDLDRAIQQEANLEALMFAVPAAPAREKTEALAKAVASAIVPFAQQMMRAGRGRAALSVCREAVRRIAPFGAGKPLAGVMTVLGDLLVELGRMSEAEQVYTQVLPMYRALSDAAGEAITLESMGRLAHAARA